MAMISTVAELGGMLLVAVGCWMIAPWLGLIVAGFGLIGIGVLADPRWSRDGS